jgi:hypothetical protein
MREFRGYAVLPWLVSAGTLLGAYSAFGTISPRVPRLMVLVIGSGILFVGVGLQFRRRFGAKSLVAWTGTAIGSLALGSAAADALDLPGEWGAWTVAFFLTPALLAAALLLHRLANRPARPALERDFPSALAAFGIGLWVGFVTLMVLLVLTIPRIG